jgi:hypothetical protein
MLVPGSKSFARTIKKGEMAETAQELLAGSGWLPEQLRTPGRGITAPSPSRDVEATSPVVSSGEESVATGYETAMANSESSAEDQPVATESHAVVAEYKGVMRHPRARRQRRAFFILECAHVHASF